MGCDDEPELHEGALVGEEREVVVRLVVRGHRVQDQIQGLGGGRHAGSVRGDHEAEGDTVM